MNTKREKKKGKRKSLRGIRIILSFALIAVVMSLVLTGGEVADFDGSTIKEIGNPEAEAPKIQAYSAEMYCSNLEQPVYQKNANEKMDPYSITKILTCYLAIENLELDKVVTVSEYAATPLEDGTTIYLKEGEKISVEELLYGAMLESGNDAARALAEEVSGSEKKFAKLMNETAKGWGCEDTNFVNSSGWKDDDHYTTAHDMAVITAKSFENEKLREIAMTEEHVIPETNMTAARELNSHTLSGKKVADMIGGKTGAWTKEDTSFAAAFSKDGIEGAVVVLRTGLKARKRDADKLIKFCTTVTPGYSVMEAGDTICESRVKGGKTNKTTLVSDASVQAYTKGNSKDGIKVEIKRTALEAPVQKGAQVGTYTVYADDKEIHSGNLLASEDIEKGWFPSRFYISNETSALLGVCLLLWLIMIIITFMAERRRTGK